MVNPPSQRANPLARLSLTLGRINFMPLLTKNERHILKHYLIWVLAFIVSIVSWNVITNAVIQMGIYSGWNDEILVQYRYTAHILWPVMTNTFASIALFLVILGCTLSLVLKYNTETITNITSLVVILFYGFIILTSGTLFLVPLIRVHELMGSP